MPASRALWSAVIIFFVSASVSAQDNAPTAAQSAGANSIGLTTLQPRKPTRAAPQFVFRIPTPAVQPKPDAKPTIVCGMTLLPANATFDAAMRKDVPQSAPNTTFSIRAVQPPICGRPQP